MKRHNGLNLIQSLDAIFASLKFNPNGLSHKELQKKTGLGGSRLNRLLLLIENAQAQPKLIIKHNEESLSYSAKRYFVQP